MIGTDVAGMSVRDGHANSEDPWWRLGLRRRTSERPLANLARLTRLGM